MKEFVLLFQSKDQKGIVALISDFIFKNGGNILSADQHSTDPHNGQFFMRVEFTVEDSVDTDKLDADFTAVEQHFDAEAVVYLKNRRARMGICVSKPDHCLADILYLWRSGELKVDIPFVVSNCEEHRRLVEQHGLPFHFIPATKEERHEERLLSLVKDSDFLVLARYMLVLSNEFLMQYGKDIINIHHGFLPSFKGPDPHRQALEQGVKVIGSTAHFVNDRLDEGPIITQAVEQVSHRDDLAGLIRKGKNLEKRALSEALSKYLDCRVVKDGNKTIVF